MHRGYRSCALVKASGRLKLFRRRASTNRDLSFLLLAIITQNVVDLSLLKALRLSATKVLKNLAGNVVADNLINSHAKSGGFVIEIFSIGGASCASDNALEDQALTGLGFAVVTIAVVDVFHCSNYTGIINIVNFYFAKYV